MDIRLNQPIIEWLVKELTLDQNYNAFKSYYFSFILRSHLSSSLYGSHVCLGTSLSLFYKPHNRRVHIK